MHYTTRINFIHLLLSHAICFANSIGVGAQSTLGGTKFLPEKYVLKISKMPEFYKILARKIINIPEFL